MGWVGFGGGEGGEDYNIFLLEASAPGTLYSARLQYNFPLVQFCSLVAVP